MQCKDVTKTISITQQKTIVEKKCRNVPDKECKLQTRVQDNPVNTTECKTVQENKCQIVVIPTEEQECKDIIEKKCKTVKDKVTEVVQVNFVRSVAVV